MKQNKYKKAFTLVEIMIVVVIIGLLTTMAIPAFNKIREQSREKVIQGNLRQLAAAGQEYILNEGVPEVTYAELIGTTEAGEGGEGLLDRLLITDICINPIKNI